MRTAMEFYCELGKALLKFIDLIKVINLTNLSQY